MSYLAPGTVLQGRYEILCEIGRGGFSVVYQARDRRIGAEVAIKLLVPPPAAARLAHERMRREVQSVRGLADPTVVAVYDFGEDGPWNFIVMEYVPGPDLHAQVQAEGSLDPERAAAIGRDIATALALAHAKGILHRDVKPQNILLDPRDGRARLTDFGSARLADQTTVTATGGLVGTPDYAAPEVFAGARGDARSDVYGLGLSLFYALVGSLPARPSPHLPPAACADGHRPARRASGIPAWLDEVVARATTVDPDDRVSSAAALRTMLSGAHALAPPLVVEPCLACGGPDALGLGVCPRCSAGGLENDTLVFVRTKTAGDREVLRAMWGGEGGEGGGSAEDARPLVRVPRSAAIKAVDRLADRGLAARAVPVRRAWTAIRPATVGLAGAVVTAGVAAGIVVAAPLFWPSPFLAAALLIGAGRAARAPLAQQRGRARFAPAIEARIVATLAELPPGAARSLLSRLVRRAARSQDGDAQRELEPVLGAACTAALELERLEQLLATAESRRGAAGGTALDALARCESTRDVLVQRLLDADAALERLQGSQADQAAATGDELGAVSRDLELQAQAIAEVEALLQPR